MMLLCGLQRKLIVALFLTTSLGTLLSLYFIEEGILSSIRLVVIAIMQCTLMIVILIFLIRKPATASVIKEKETDAIGKMVSGIVHEINNPVNYIGANLVSLEEYIEDMNKLIREYEKYENSLPLLEQKMEVSHIKKEIDLDYIRGDINSLLLSCKEGVRCIGETVNELRTFFKSNK